MLLVPKEAWPADSVIGKSTKNEINSMQSAFLMKRGSALGRIADTSQRQNQGSNTG